jgi:outer membrane protein assembly factor BamB
MVSPLPPLVINGVVFAASSGEYHPASGVAMAASERAQKSVPAVMYALDEASGKQLWSSGKTITSFVAGTPVWASVGQAYIATYDNTVYAFGFAMERYISQQ